MLDNIIDINETSFRISTSVFIIYTERSSRFSRFKLGDRSRVTMLIAKAGKIRRARMEEVKGLEFFSIFFLSTTIWRNF